MAKEEEIVLEREYIIPLRKEWQKVPCYKRAKKTIKAIKKFLSRHMKLYLTEEEAKKKIKIGRWLNEEIWKRSIKKPPVKVRVKATKDNKGIVKVELAELPEKARWLEKKEEAKAKEEKKPEKPEGKAEEKKAEKPEEKKAEEKKEEKPEEEEEEKKEKKEKEKILHKEIKKVEKELIKPRRPIERRKALEK